MIPRKKKSFLIGMLLLYAFLGVVFFAMVQMGIVSRLAPAALEELGPDVVGDTDLVQVARTRLDLAETFTKDVLVRDSGHVDLYRNVDGGAFQDDLQTNSEAVSYTLQWAVKAGDKELFDRVLGFTRDKMLHPEGKYMRWRLTPDDKVVADGGNIASDADLRAVNALLLAEKRWGDQEYSRMITTLAQGMETVAVTRDNYLAPYGGGAGEGAWTANEVWISYVDFPAIDGLATRRGDPWNRMREKMETALVQGQIHNGLYNSELTNKRVYGNGPDGGGYGINSMWMMVRAAESGDPQLKESARKSLEFYKGKYVIDAQLYALYSSNGDALSPYDAPWVYALIGRAAVALEDEEFADAMVTKLLSFQQEDGEYAGAFLEGPVGDRRVGQFTMQESILTLQDYVAMKERLAKERG